MNVSGYNPNGSITRDLRTVSAALVYDDSVSGETVILLVHQASIYIPELPHNLLSTMQVHLNDVIVNETPRFLADTVTDHTHCILVPTDDGDSPYGIPLSITGVTSSFPTRRPTVEEYESLPHLCLTSDEPIYDPADTTFTEQEQTFLKHLLETGDRTGAPPPSRRLCTVSKTRLATRSIGTGLDSVSQSLRQTSPTFDDCVFSASLSVLCVDALHQRGGGKHYDVDLLARNWGIDRKTARRTIDATTQRGVRTVLHPTLSRRFRTNNDRQLRYRRLPVDCFTDTLISSIASKRNNKYAQIFVTAEGWCRAYPMAKKSQGREGLLLLL